MEPPEVVDRRVTAIPDFACYIPQREEPPDPPDPVEHFRRQAHVWLASAKRKAVSEPST